MLENWRDLNMEIMISDLEMTYSNGKKALQDINLVLESPNLIGLLGPKGGIR